VFGIDFGDLTGIPAPSLDLSGPTVSFGLVFGGIGPLTGFDKGRLIGDAQATSASAGSFVVDVGSELIIENALGDIVISGYSVDATQTTPNRVVEWQAVRTAARRRIDELQVISDVSEPSITLKTVGTGRVDYILRVPIGIDLKVKNGAGDIHLVSYEAQTIIIENGTGNLSLSDVRATALIVAHGVGEIDLTNVNTQQLIVSLGVGEIVLALPASTSATLSAKAGIGNVSIDRFPGMIGGVRGFLGKSGDVTLGSGERSVKLDVGLGEIVIEMQQP
ncbi:DUF4097 family beta strand repeat protein, partial [Candidatus Bipolaricaulota bacterium]|nr:DUF4097 family beta strand repeat protein [Candidatus Bipolaricaulota bacterium]